MLGREIDVPILFRNFSAPLALGGSWWAAVQASFKVSEYSGTGLSTVAVTGCGNSTFPSSAGAAGAGLLSGVLLFEENFLKSFGVGIRLVREEKNARTAGPKPFRIYPDGVV